MPFNAINLSERMIASLKRQHFYDPSAIQLRVIPKALKGENLLIQSATGTGKTLSFVIPIIEQIDLKNQNLQAIVVAPTRELAQQIFETFSGFEKDYPELKVRLFKSGTERENSMKGLSVAPHVIIGTPGRLADIFEKDLISLSNVRTIVLDEADMLLKEGFFPDIDRFVLRISHPQFLVCSATLEANLGHELEKYIGADQLVINEEVMTSSTVEHLLVDIGHQDLNQAVLSLIKIIHPYLLLAFASKKETANKVYEFLKSNGQPVGLLTGDLNARERKNVLKRLKNGEIYYLVCSDMAARGLDIEDVTDILNVDLPENLDFYYHRAGRTGRFGKKGKCYTFYNNEHTSKPLALKEQGVQFKYLVLKDGELSLGHEIAKPHPTSKKKDSELDQKIRKVVNLSKGKNMKVKPGYKKKVREEVKKVKQQHRREIIKKDIRRQRVERYRKENRQNG